jgi:hypothetical protein
MRELSLIEEPGASACQLQGIYGKPITAERC